MKKVKKIDSLESEREVCIMVAVFYGICALALAVGMIDCAIKNYKTWDVDQSAKGLFEGIIMATFAIGVIKMAIIAEKISAKIQKLKLPAC